MTSLQRLLKYLIVHIGVADDAAAIEASVLRLFHDDIQRSVDIGGREARQSIHDNYVAPPYIPLRHETVMQLCEDEHMRLYASNPALDASSLFGSGSMTERADEAGMDDWVAVNASQSMIAVEDGGHHHLGALESACGLAAERLSSAVDKLVVDPTLTQWEAAIDAATAYAESAGAALAVLGADAQKQLRAFIADLAAVSETVGEALRQGAPVGSLPETAVLFKKRSGMPMASWVLHRPGPIPQNPLPGRDQS